jgi:hypothetical protein
MSGKTAFFAKKVKKLEKNAINAFQTPKLW